MRTKRTVINIVTSLIYQILVLLVGFYVPRLIIQTYGSRINGLNSTISQILNIINFLQAGLVGASIYEMYSQIANNDNDGEASIYYASKHHFDRLSSYFFLLSIFIIPYLHFSKSGEELKLYEIVLTVLLMGVNSLLLFKYFTVYDILFSSHEEKYILIISQAINKLIYYLFLFCCVIFRMNYIYIFIGNLFATIICLLFLKYRYKIEYQEKFKRAQVREYKIKNQYHLFANQIMQQVNESMPIIVISGIYSLSYASVYSVYLLVCNFIKTIFITILNAISAGFGNLNAYGNKDKTQKVFDIIDYLIFSLSLIIIFPMAILLNSFIDIYTSDLNDIVYRNNILSIMCIIYTLSYIYYSLYDFALTNMGLFSKVIKPTIIIAIISSFTTIVCTKTNYAIALSGIIFFYISLSAVRIRAISKKINISLQAFFLRPFILVFLICIGCFIRNEINGVKQWLLSGVLAEMISLILLILYSVLFEKKCLHDLFVYVKEVKFKRNGN